MEEWQEPIDMQVAKNYLENAFTDAIGLHREIVSAIEAGQGDGVLEYYKMNAKEIAISIETFCQHLNIKMMYICTDEDWFDGPVNCLSAYKVGIYLSKSLEQLQAYLELMINILKFTCERGCGAYANNPGFNEFDGYCSFITSCLNYVPMAA